MTTLNGFRELHRQGIFIMPNAWDVGSARLLEHLGFAAIATTSSGFAGTLGRRDQRVRRDELLAHVEAMTAAVRLPVSVDAERCYPDEAGGVARTVELIANAGAAGCSIEDYDPAAGVLPIEAATARVAEAVSVAARHGLVITARAENHLYGVDHLDDTIARLVAYRDAGADVLYAPGLAALADIERVVREVEAPINVLTVPGGPPIPELARAGVRRVSTGGALAWVAYGALVTAGRELLDKGTTTFLEELLDGAVRASAFSDEAPTDRGGID
ncbi:MAG TPA: isocitrate lyase/phosphoenolpyruvate mutase family protein [Jiangellaceae bacterium]